MRSKPACSPIPLAAARSYLKIATAYGHPAAQYALGVMNIKGEGVKRNPQQGLKWLMAAARKRYAPAEAYLGELYWDGKIVPRRPDSRRDVVHPRPRVGAARGKPGNL